MAVSITDLRIANRFALSMELNWPETFCLTFPFLTIFSTPFLLGGTLGVAIKNTGYNLALPEAIFTAFWIEDNHLVLDNAAIAPIYQSKFADFHLGNNNREQ